MSLKSIALSLGISAAYWSKVERGLASPPSDDLLLKFSACLKINSDDVFVAAKRLPVDMRPHIKLIVKLYRSNQKMMGA